MANTRWNPSLSGSLHLGHVYSMLVNERFAHQTGGKFYIRFDDTSQGVVLESKHPERIPMLKEKQIEDIQWLEIQVDGWQTQSEIMPEVHKELKKHGLFGLGDVFPHYLPVSIRFGSNWIPYPYTANQTAERVVMDNMLEITHVIRGEEFLTEYSLYRYFSEVMGMKFPEFIFLPRLTSIHGDISKTNGGYKIAEMRQNGMSPQDVISLVEDACLIWKYNGWNFINLKPNPRVNM